MEVSGDVLARAAGGVLDTVVPEVTGTLVNMTSEAEGAQIDAFAKAMQEFDSDRFDPDKSRANAETFSTANFRANVAEAVRTILEPSA